MYVKIENHHWSGYRFELDISVAEALQQICENSCCLFPDIDKLIDQINGMKVAAFLDFVFVEKVLSDLGCLLMMEECYQQPRDADLIQVINQFTESLKICKDNFTQQHRAWKAYVLLKLPCFKLWCLTE